MATAIFFGCMMIAETQGFKLEQEEMEAAKWLVGAFIVHDLFRLFK